MGLSAVDPQHVRYGHLSAANMTHLLTTAAPVTSHPHLCHLIVHHAPWKGCAFSRDFLENISGEC